MANTFTVGSIVQETIGGTGREKSVTFTATGPSTYNSSNAGYATIDLSTSGTLGSMGFSRVYSVEKVGTSVYTTGRYEVQHTYGTTPSTTQLTVRDADSSCAVVAVNTDLSATTFYLRATGY